MIPLKPIRFDAAQVQAMRAADPIHVPPPAQPLGAEIELMLAGTAVQPLMVITDPRDETEKRIVMEAQGADQWTARVLLPDHPTVIRYHFEIGAEKFEALRQVESLIPGEPNPTYGEWERRPFQIAVYDPKQVPPEWTQGQIIYQIFPDRFAKAEMPTQQRVARHTHGNETLYLKWDDLPEIPPQGRDFYGGNLRGITAKLDYLVELGIQCVYLTPIFESPSNHRYDAMDYFRIDPLLGTEADLQELVDQAHQRGLKVMLDIVANHCSNDSRYFNRAGWYTDAGAYQSQTSPYYEWFTFEEWAEKYQGWAGVPTMPQFNESEAVQAFFFGENGVCHYWMRTGIDGWRSDVTPWKSLGFWRRFRESVRAINPTAYLIAEEWNDASHYLVGDSFDATMNYRLAWALRGYFALRTLSTVEFHERLETVIRDTPAPMLHSQMNLIDSHDTARALSVCEGDQQRLMQMLAFLLAYPGSPMLYYGNEFGLEGTFAEDGRRSVPWGYDDPALLPFYQRALAFRRESEALRCGDFTALLVSESPRGYAFARENQVIAVFNAESGSVTMQIPVGAAEGTQWRDALAWNADGFVRSGKLEVMLKGNSGAWFIPVDRGDFSST